MSITSGLVDTHHEDEQAATRAARSWFVRHAWAVVVLAMIAFWLAVAAALCSAL